jgi:receptor protein-tyrosine kinase
MSKHFELMQQMEEEQASGASTEPKSTLRSDLPGALTRDRRPWASLETQRIVQQVFLPQTSVPPRAAVFAGVDHGSGCSHVCASVAEALARNSQRLVCLVDANFYAPALPQLLGVANRQGLSDALLRHGPIDSYTRQVAEERLFLLSSGAPVPDPSSLLASGRLRERMEELRERFDYVIVDAPPLTLYPDALALGQLTDGVVMVLEAAATRRDAAAASAANMRSLNIPILAAVLNKRDFPMPQVIYRRL